MFCAKGSSPLTRGKPVVGGDDFDGDGLIPAHAGKTIGVCRWTDNHRAHPRSRGENKHAATPQPIAWGSSPLTRGKPPLAKVPVPRDGLIPAHAGKTVATWARWAFCRAHPRSRGENDMTTSLASVDWGSSPLTRGKR